jgi:choline dehydrogenase-like flavoprotein
VISFGFVSEGSGGKSEIPMSTGFRDKEHGVVFVSYLSTRMIWALLVLAEGNFGALRHLHRYGKALGVLCKVTDEMEGRVFADGKATKTYTARDLWRLDYGRVTNERILIKAGCDPYNIYHGRPTLGHPSATAGVGKLVDSDLQTEIKNLYCCDTSVFPEAPAIPPALTVTILGKRLARHLETIL